MDDQHDEHDQPWSVPARQPGSMRRTQHITAHPEATAIGFVGRARDLRTNPSGVAEVVAEVTIHGRVERTRARVLTSFEVTGAACPVDLVGASLAAGFRRRLADLEPASLLAGLVDDLPIVAQLSSGMAKRMDGDEEVRAWPDPSTCIGWQPDGHLERTVVRLGRPIERRRAAPLLGRADDPQAWHEIEEAEVWSLRRHRRTDVWWAADTGALQVDAMFIDTALEPPEPYFCVVHNYRLAATVLDGLLVDLEARPGNLPGPDCPSARAGLAAVIGTPTDTLRRQATSALGGPTGCTHLTDAVRFLGDAEALARSLTGDGAPAPDAPRASE